MPRTTGSKDKTKRKNKILRNTALGVGSTALVTGGLGLAAKKGVLGQRAKGAAILGEIVAKGTYNSLKRKAKNLVTKGTKKTVSTATSVPRTINID